MISLDCAATAGNSNFTHNGGAGSDLNLGCTLGSVNVSGGEADAAAVSIQAASGGVDIDGALQVNVASSQAAAGSITINASGDGGFTRISSNVDPTVEDPVLDINGGIAGRGSHIRSTQTTAPTVGVTGDTIDGAADVVTDMAGRINLSTTAGNGAGTVTVTYNQSYATTPSVVFVQGPGTIGTSVQLTVSSTALFTIGYTTPAGAGTAHSFNYHVIEV